MFLHLPNWAGKLFNFTVLYVFMVLALKVPLATCHMNILIHRDGERTISIGDGRLVTITNDNFTLACDSTFPVFWTYERIEEHPTRFEWTTRSDYGVFYAYITFMRRTEFDLEIVECLAFELDKEVSIVFLSFQPDDNKIDARLTVRAHKNTGTVVQIPNMANGCGAEFIFLSHLGRNFVRCELLNSANKSDVKIIKCQTSAYCANTFREAKKLKSCVRHLNSSAEYTDQYAWTEIKTFDAGTAICLTQSVNETMQSDSLAIEYFFIYTTDGRRQLPIFSGTSLEKVDPADMVYITAAAGTYYTDERSEITCDVPTYGFSRYTFMKIRHCQTGYSVLEEELNYLEDGTCQCQGFFYPPFVGEYVVECIAAVWNSTDSVNKTAVFNVKESLPVMFDTASETVKLKDGDNYHVLQCNSSGDPSPNITWIFGRIPAYVNGSNLVLTNISYKYTEGVVTCHAKNIFGSSAEKLFYLHVEKQHATKPASSNTEIAIGVSASSVVGLFALLAFIYWKYRRLGNKIRIFLTDEEVQEFLQGRQDRRNKENLDSATSASGSLFAIDKIVVDDINENLETEYLAYNNEFECTQDNLIVDKNSQLGSGQFGIVYKGFIKRSNGELYPVAFKTVRSNANISYFKALLSELKILAHIGAHDNIVNLVGTSTSKIKQRELYVGVELCVTSMHEHLRANKWKFKNFVRNDILESETGLSMEYNNVPKNSMSTMDLIRWSMEIAKGMEFLAAKKVIHADLATRNILLTNDLTAKICDFGLARQLIDYDYIKSDKHCPLPWKWMAIESLSQMNFSTYSDVWSYGITLWETFSLGDVPYPGLAWTTDFVELLRQGLRLKKPIYATEEMYDWMVECWRDERNKRPTFSDLQNYFQSLQSA